MDKRMSNIIILSSMQTFLTRSLGEKLLANSINSREIKPNVDMISTLSHDVDGLVIFADDEMLMDYQLMVFIKDWAMGRDIPVFAIGKPEEITRIEEIFSEESLKGAYMRPVDFNEVVSHIDKYLRFFKDEERKRILVVDDSGAALRSAKGMFEDKYQVTLAESAAMAIKCITIHIPDLIIMDYDMPIINGKQAFEMIKAETEFSGIPVMFLTSRDDVATVKSIMELRPVAYMLKNRPAAEIREVVDTYFQKKKALMG